MLTACSNTKCQLTTTNLTALFCCNPKLDLYFDVAYVLGRMCFGTMDACGTL